MKTEHLWDSQMDVTPADCGWTLSVTRCHNHQLSQKKVTKVVMECWWWKQLDHCTGMGNDENFWSETVPATPGMSTDYSNSSGVHNTFLAVKSTLGTYSYSLGKLVTITNLGKCFKPIHGMQAA